MRNKIIGFAVAVAMSVGLIETLEGVEYKPYKDIAGIWTVCSGVTGADVIPGKLYTDRECKILNEKHSKWARDTVDRLVKVEIPESMRAALYSHTYHTGSGAFSRSTILKEANKGNLYKACEHLYDWVYYTDPKTKKKKFSKGLWNRKNQEFQVCVRDLK